MNPALAAQTALLNTLQEIQDRAQVEECVRDMLIDVEIAVSLAERLKARQEIQGLQRRMLEQDAVVEESRALRKDAADKQAAMADALLREMLALSKEISQLNEIKKQHGELLVQYDEVVTKLIQAEEMVQEGATNSEKVNQQSSPHTAVEIKKDSTDVRYSAATEDVSSATTVNVDSKAEVELGLNNHATGESTTEATPQQTIVVTSESINSAAAAAAVSAMTVEEELLLSRDETPEINATESTDEASVAVAAVTLDDDEEGEPDTPRFDEFDTEIFMKIFSYLDALDILNTAQISIRMYTRVDALFGFGASEHDDMGPPQQQQQHEDNSTNETTSYSATAQQQQQQPTVSSETDTKATASSSKATTTTTTASIVPQQPTIVALPPAPAKSTAATAVTNTAVPSVPKHKPSSSVDAAINRGISLLLQPRKQLQNAGSSLSPAVSPKRSFLRTAPAPPPSSSSSSYSTTSGPLPMNAAMANSMAAKLSDAELNAIILMTERLKQKESLCVKRTKENEILAANLDGTEGVKQFLIAKVRDMEATLTATVKNEIKVAQQIASDQEVIAFLDSRVQELESEARTLRNAKEAAINELERVQRQSNQKATVMGDMLQFEREKVKDNDREWKATKKLLIKEVKSCRSQILALQAERDGYREQNETLRKAVVNSQNGNMHSRDRTFA